MATKQYQITQLNANEELDVLHPETDADIVIVEKGTGKYQGEADNVQDALEEIYEMAETGGVTSVNGKTGAVTLNASDVGAEAAFTDGSATIASESNGVVTIKGGVSQSGGAIANSSGADITLGTAAKKGVATSISSSSTNNDLATAKAVYDAIDALPEPMIFKGTLGTGGTITTLPTASAANEGYTYKVITSGTYASTSAKVGDAFISNGTAWILIPSGDDVEDTWRGVNVNGTALLGNGISTGALNLKSGTGVGVSGSGNDVTIALADNYGDTKNPYASKTKNYVLAAPSSANGVPSFRALATSDIPDLSGTYQPLDANLTAIAGLSGTSGLLKKTAENTWALDTNTYKTENDSITVTIKGGKKANGTTDISANASGKTSITVTMADTGVDASQIYSAVQVNAKGLVVGGAKILEVGSKSGTNTPTANLAIGGIFFKEL